MLSKLRVQLSQTRGAFWNLRQRRYGRCHQNSRILSSGRILNSGPAQNITLGNYSWLAGELLVYPHGGRIDIGEYCYIGEGTKIWSLARVKIGNRVFLSHGVNVHDNDAHSVSAEKRHHHFRDLVERGSATFVEEVTVGEIDIADDVWIGFNAVILKGVKIGEGAIVGAGSIVTRDVAAYAVVAGSPAVQVGQSLP